MQGSIVAKSIMKQIIPKNGRSFSRLHGYLQIGKNSGTSHFNIRKLSKLKDFDLKRSKMVNTLSLTYINTVAILSPRKV